jgi:hypothetical protein
VPLDSHPENTGEIGTKKILDSNGHPHYRNQKWNPGLEVEHVERMEEEMHMCLAQ